jgi:hypothetical protein
MESKQQTNSRRILKRSRLTRGLPARIGKTLVEVLKG